MNESLTLLKRIQALCEHGIYYSHNEFDKSRYQEIEETVFTLITSNFGLEKEKTKILMEERDGYKTPKVDVRAVIFNNQGKILLVKELIDGNWSLPGGWADIGYTPSEVAVKEAHEEAGAVVKAGRLIALQDKRCHEHPEDLFYIYKVFIECTFIKQEIPDHLETSDFGYFGLDELPPLSTPRNTLSQIQMLFDFNNGKITETIID
jgi:ADP-ribose pyrophosphatase YjhB (NUDIX family)